MILSEDRFSNLKGSRAGIVLEGRCELLIEKSLCFGFKANKYHVEYDALIVGMILAREMGATSLRARSES